MKNRRLPLVRPEMKTVRPLGDAWRTLLDDLAKSRGFPTTAEPAKLGALVATLSQAYNATGPGPTQARSTEAHAARLLFSFPRDVPKSAAAIRELVAAKAIARPTDRPLRLLDLGAGLGATTWGIARAIGGAFTVTMVDDDAQALNLADAIATRARDANVEPDVDLTLDAKHLRSVSSFHADPGTADEGYDIIVAGQVVSELDRARTPEERVREHVKRLALWLGWLRDAPGSVLVVVEPALRERARHLHAVRDALLAEHATAHVLHPCLHRAPCPVLPIETEWCHDDVAIDLPEWLVPVARAAGLRWQGLGFAPLVLARRPDAALTVTSNAETSEARVISDALMSKGKCEAFVCTDGAARVRVMRLDREATDDNAAWDDLARYDRLRFSPPLDGNGGRARLPAGARVTRFAPPA